MLLERVIFSGTGGQGLMFIGKLFAKMMMDTVPYLTFFPSYGSEVRGGTANCQVVLSSKEIASPIVDEADSMLLMNQPSVDRFLPCLAAGGKAFVNSTLAHVPEGSDAILVPASQIGQDSGDVRAANVALFGAFLGSKAFVSCDEAQQFVAGISALKGEQFEEINARSFQAGWDLVA